jgi:hypothetical protein
MFKKLFSRLFLCSVLGHQRCRNRVRDVEGMFTSVCTRCNAPMRRLDHNRKWSADRLARELRASSSSSS